MESSNSEKIGPGRKPELWDLTGKFFPEGKTPIGRLRDFLVNHQVEKTFWTPERKVLAQKIVGAVNQELEPFGAPKVEFRQDQVKLLKKEAMGFISGQYLAHAGYIELCPELINSDEEFAMVYAHEILHHLSLRLALKKGEKEVWRRIGLSMKVKPEQEKEALFKDLNEGVILKTTEQILKKYLSLKYSTDWEWEKLLVDNICVTISAVNNQEYPSPEDVFRVFQKATFGRGRALELGRLIEKTYGKGGFRQLADLLTQVPKTETTLLGRKVWEIDQNSSQHKKLFEFLRGFTISPRRRLDVFQREILEAARKVGKERRRWYNWMKSIVGRLNIKPLSENDLVVNVGCGNGRDNLPINSALTGQPFGWPGKCRVIGVDEDKRVVEQAERES